jgi:hemerythrin-like domain-containing protein
MNKDQEEWTAKFTVLKENVEHHVEEEEGDMFPKARKVLSDKQAEALGTRMEEAKKQQLKAAAGR